MLHNHHGEMSTVTVVATTHGDYRWRVWECRGWSLRSPTVAWVVCCWFEWHTTTSVLHSSPVILQWNLIC